MNNNNEEKKQQSAIKQFLPQILEGLKEFGALEQTPEEREVFVEKVGSDELGEDFILHFSPPIAASEPERKPDDEPPF